MASDPFAGDGKLAGFLRWWLQPWTQNQPEREGDVRCDEDQNQSVYLFGGLDLGKPRSERALMVSGGGNRIEQRKKTEIWVSFGDGSNCGHNRRESVGGNGQCWSCGRQQPEGDDGWREAAVAEGRRRRPE